MCTVWEFKTRNFRALLEWDYDQYPDLSWADEETKRRIDDGSWVVADFTVRVFFRDMEIGSDSLGGSVYEDTSDFYREHLGIALGRRVSGENYGCYFSDMIREAIKQARANMAEIHAIKLRV